MINYITGILSHPKAEFLQSTRFWAIVIGAIVFGMFDAGAIDESVFMAIEIILSGFTTVRTVDRFGEKVGN